MYIQSHVLEGMIKFSIRNAPMSNIGPYPLREKIIQPPPQQRILFPPPRKKIPKPPEKKSTAHIYESGSVHVREINSFPRTPWASFIGGRTGARGQSRCSSGTTSCRVGGSNRRDRKILPRYFARANGSLPIPRVSHLEARRK
ncbi:hypothetical protein CEXT_264081 [Caerostris extrusa]|uniref:Uncharacterized protein n=1 Tax=Caerostris extrusa TaxID=172846 RepID=A0AAV4P7X1_CAEEX|nr:hypothetical protein CEXT_264081 [Caerostris extrusa]